MASTKNSSAPLTAVIAEDSVLFRELLRRVCQQELGLNIVGETGSGRETLNFVTQNQPDVLLLELRLNDVDGFTVIAACQQQTKLGNDNYFSPVTTIKTPRVFEGV